MSEQSVISTVVLGSPVALPHQIQQASAGTGKTFALSNRYLKLLALGCDPASILAATFTRKGAGEIMDRVMSRLCQAARSTQQRQRLAEFLDLQTDDVHPLQLLRSLTSQLHRLQIGTIDSYFHRLAKVMSLELGLPFDWEIGEEVQLDALRGQALGDILNHQQAIELLRLISKGDAARSVAAKMEQTIDDAYGYWRESSAQAWQEWTRYLAVSDAQIDAFRERHPNPSFSGNRQQQRWEADMQLLQDRDWDRLIAGSALASVRDGEPGYYGPMPEDLIAAYRDLAELAAQAIAFDVGRKTMAAGELIGHYDAALSPLQRRSGLLGFDDVTRWLIEIAHELDEAAGTRLGSHIDHVLLDEFQDTSPGQWQVVAPVVRRVTSNESRGSFYCVGDKKQAIYAWRGGVAEIFDVVESQLQDRLSPCQPLVASRRSAQPIIDTVNRVFSNLNMVNESRPAGKRGLQQMAESFVEHSTARSELAGFVELRRVAPKKETPEGQTADESCKQAVLQAAVEDVCRIHRARPGASIAVLVRGNAEIPTLVQQLQSRGVPASEEGGNPLVDSAAVDFVLSALQLLDHPSDGPARFHLSHGPLCGLFELQPEASRTQASNETAAQRSAARWRRVLAEEGLAPMLIQWAHELSDYCGDRERLRLQQLIELAEAYDSIGRERPSHFARFVREKPVVEPSTAKIRVMTIHASKGLEFDVVVAPMLQQRSGWSPKPPAFVSRRPAPELPIDSIVRYVGENERRFLSAEIQRIFEDSYQAQVRDELCVLYVMLTRAIHELRILVPQRASRTHYSPNGVVLATLTEEGCDGGGVLYSCGDPEWHFSVDGDPSARQVPDGAHGQYYLEPRIQLAELERRQSSMQASQVAEPPLAKSEWRLGIPTIAERMRRAARQNEGLWLHACFEATRWIEESEWPVLEELLEDPHLNSLIPAVDAATRRFHLNQVQSSQLRDEFCRAVVAGQGKQVFDRDKYWKMLSNRLKQLQGQPADRYELNVRREFRLMGQRNENNWGEGIIDRLVLVENGGKVVAAHIIDFKSEQFAGASEVDLHDKHFEQVQIYRRFVAKRWGLPVGDVLADLFFTRSGALFAVESTRGNWQ